jgi:thiamine phosphate synthase YjbQ (UPF0047 family)
MRQATGMIEIGTERPGLHEVTDRVARWVEGQGMSEGLLTSSAATPRLRS